MFVLPQNHYIKMSNINTLAYSVEWETLVAAQTKTLISLNFV